MGLQQVGLTEKQWAGGHYSAAAMVQPYLKEISFKKIFSINQVQWPGGRNSITPPAASPERWASYFKRSVQMTQKEFTDFIIPGVIEQFPQFAGLCTYKPDDIVDIDYKSNNEKLTIWLTTQNREITLGFTGITDCDWHAHMSSLGANSPVEELTVAVKFISDLLNDRKMIAFEKSRGYYRTFDRGSIGKGEGETYELFTWSEL